VGANFVEKITNKDNSEWPGQTKTRAIDKQPIKY
jgi:hypothetical protein